MITNYLFGQRARGPEGTVATYTIRPIRTHRWSLWLATFTGAAPNSDTWSRPTRSKRSKTGSIVIVISTEGISDHRSLRERDLIRAEITLKEFSGY